MNTHKRIELEPELEAIAGELDPRERMRLAVIFAERGARLLRWARQLRVSAVALRPAPPRPLRLRRLSVAVLGRN